MTYDYLLDRLIIRHFDNVINFISNLRLVVKNPKF